MVFPAGNTGFQFGNKRSSAEIAAFGFFKYQFLPAFCAEAVPGFFRIEQCGSAERAADGKN
jgi:hypothetical protein